MGDAPKQALGLYVHVPFCTHHCAYCHFFKQPLSPEKVDIFLQSLAQERAAWQSVWERRPFETIFIGGGSPSCLCAEDLQRLGDLCPVSSQLREWTVEVSPWSIDEARLRVLKALGVTRISMGVQSFNAKILQSLGRYVAPVERVYQTIRAVGFTNVNLDLIFPPGFSDLRRWRQDLERAIALHPAHVSTYCLTYEAANGPFASVQQPVDDEREAEFYQFTWEFLEQQGYRHYEVSNFAKPGFACRHNRNTWRMQEWLGWGPTAASQFNRRRFQNRRHLRWRPNHYTQVCALTDRMLCQDCLMFGLRLCDGIQLDQLQKRFPRVDLSAYQPLWDWFCEQGWATLDQHCLRCTPKGLLLADRLAVEILSHPV